MSGDISGNSSAAKTKSDWHRLRRMTDDEVHRALKADPDARETDEAFWTTARLVVPQRKKPVTIRLDADLLAWYRREKGYQTRINAILRAYMKAQSKPAAT